MFIWIAPLNYETISIEIYFLSNNKALLSSTRTSYIIAENNKHENVSERSNLLLLLGCYMRNNLARLRRYPTHLDLADVSNLFYFHFVFI